MSTEIPTTNKRVAIAIGGSILFPENENPVFLSEMAKMITETSKQHQLLLVIGGGYPARRNIATVRDPKIDITDETLLDMIGVAATRLNAQKFAVILKNVGANVNLDIPRTIEEALELAEQHSIVVMGGTTPGHSTDFVAAELAIKKPITGAAPGHTTDFVGAALATEGTCTHLVIATNVSGVYTADPRKDPNAEFKQNLTFYELREIIGDFNWGGAGSPGVIDGPCTKLICETGMPTIVVDGKEISNLQKAITGENFHGTHISGEKIINI